MINKNYFIEVYVIELFGKIATNILYKKYHIKFFMF